MDNHYPNKKKIERAMNAIALAAPKASAEPTRPIYHMIPPAQWMNDVCGTIYHKGYYHLCYLINPFGDYISRQQTWGHARSKNLIHWEHLPIPFWPDGTATEDGIYTGGAIINALAQPMYFWTANPRAGSNKQRTVAAATSDDVMINWYKLPKNPILCRGENGDPAFEGEWDAPFLFQTENRSFLLLSATENGDPVLPLYEAANPEFTKWKYQKILFRLTNRGIAEMECQNFVEFANSNWLLLYSPDDTQMRYHAGTFDLDKLIFEPTTEGIVDHSYGINNDPRERGFYASNVLDSPDGRKILFAWISGFRDKSGDLYMHPGEGDRPGWNSCVSIPREISLGVDNKLIQTPISELKQLRYNQISPPHLLIDDETRQITGAEGNTLEIQLSIKLTGAMEAGLYLLSENSPAPTGLIISCDNSKINICGTSIPLSVDLQGFVSLHIFLDRSVIEVFVNEGRECITRAVSAKEKHLLTKVFALKGKAEIRNFTLWHMKSIW